MNMRDQLISEITARLKDANITRVAANAGVARVTIATLADPNRLPRKSTIIALAVYLGIDIPEGF